MEIAFLDQAKKDLEEWRLNGNKKIQQKIQALIADILQRPFDRIGKPEALKYGFNGQWSRRISGEHRLIYEIREGILFIYSLKGHYE